MRIYYIIRPHCFGRDDVVVKAIRPAGSKPPDLHYV